LAGSSFHNVTEFSLPNGRAAICSVHPEPADPQMSSRAAQFPPENASQPSAIERAADWQVEEPHSFLSDTASFLNRVKLKLKSDEELVVLLQAGDADILTVLFERYSALIFRIARRILGNDAEAEDAVQQVFLDFLRSVDKFDPLRGTFKAWLLMFAYCRTINHKSRLTSRHFYETDSLEDTPEELLAGSKRAFPFNSGEISRIVDEALGSIQPRQRRTIELVYYEGLSPAEVAERTGESVRMVRHNLYRGLDKARSLLFEKSEKKKNRTKHEDA
jgi:RNA polymerase sigma-70 factor, ECF subfamily